MDIPTAEAAQAALQQINAVTALVTAVQAEVANGSTVVSIRTSTGNSIDFSQIPLGQTESAAVLNGILTTLQALQASATATLTALG